MKQMNQTEALIEAIRQNERLQLLRIVEQAKDLSAVREYLKQAISSR